MATSHTTLLEPHHDTNLPGNTMARHEDRLLNAPLTADFGNRINGMEQGVHSEPQQSLGSEAGITGRCFASSTELGCDLGDITAIDHDSCYRMLTSDDKLAGQS